MRWLATLLLLVIAAGFAGLFLTRYWFWRDCINAAASSCVTPDGSNLIAGGMVWLVPAVVFAILALAVWLRRV